MRNLSFIFICALIMQPQSLLAAPQPAKAVAGTIVFSAGNNTAISATGEQRPVKKGDTVKSGDKLQTDGRLQVRFTDNGFVSLKPKSQLLINEYAFSGKEDGTERAFFKLLKGSVRAVTGFIGKHDKNAYKYETPVATIGIRGTAFVLNYCNKDCFGNDGSLLPDGLYVNNGEGRVYVQTNEGTIDLVRGQFAFVQDIESKPEQITEPPAMREMFREETEEYDFDFRSTENVIENIRENPSLVDGGLGEVQSLSFSLIGGDLGTDQHSFLLDGSSENSIKIDENGAVITYEFFDAVLGRVVRFDSRNARLFEERSGVNSIFDASWGIWEGGYRYTDETLGTVLENNPQYLAYMAFANPTSPDRLPSSGTARFNNVDLDRAANGAFNPMTREMSNSFTADIGVDWVNQQFTNFDLTATFDSSRLELGITDAVSISNPSISLSGEYNNGLPMTAFGNANFQFANEASVIGGTFEARASVNQVAIGTFLVGEENGAVPAPIPETEEIIR